MPVGIKDYLDSMKTVSSSTNTKIKAKAQSDLKTQQLLSQLLEALAYSNSISMKKKELNAIAKGNNPDKLTNKQVLNLLKNQEKLIQQLSQGQKLNRQQTRELNNAIDRFYDVAGSQEINYKKFAASLEKFALTGNFPEAVQNRLINDSRDAHIIGKEQKDKDGILLPIIKKIRNLLEDSVENTKQFSKKLFVTLDQFREEFLSGLSGLMEEIKDQNFFTQFVKNIAGFLKTVGTLWMSFQGQFSEGNFKWGQLFKQFNNIKKIFSITKNLEKFSAKSLSGVPDLIKGLKTLGKIPKLVGKLGLAKSITGGLFKATKYGLKGLTKIPIIGSLFSIWMAQYRWKQGDKKGALIELGSGVAALFPGIGTLVSIGLDLINLGRDTSFFEKQKENITNKFNSLSLEAKMGIPVIGPIFGITEAIKLWNQGDKKGALSIASKAFGSILSPGSQTHNIISLFQELSGNNTLNKSYSKSAGYHRGDNGGDAPISWQNESGNYSSKGLIQSAKNAAKNFNKLIGGGLVVTSAFRDPAKMMPLWNSAKPIPGSRNRINKYGNEMADARRSNHAKGRAIDVAMSLYKNIGANKFTKLAKQAGFSLIYPEHSAVHLEVPKSGTIKENTSTNTAITAKASTIEPLAENQNTIDNFEVASNTLITFDDAIAMFNKFNQDIANTITDKTTSKSIGTVHPESNIAPPSLEKITSGTPANTIANTSAITASKISTNFNNSNKQLQTQVMQPVQSPVAPDTIDTEIKDTDLALLNSLLFQ